MHELLINKRFWFIFLALACLVGLILAVNSKKQGEPIAKSPEESPIQLKNDAVFVSPISDPIPRVTKKPFGIHVTPANSPVSPEKFTGFHTGVDFEAFPSEKDTDVPISAICDGKLLKSEFGRGYGGMAVEECSLNGNPVTVVYGHLRLASVKLKAGEPMKKGQQFAVLGTGESTETDGERKHLHLGIHIGSTIDTRGYVSSSSLLSNWMNIMDYLNK